jgi:hypothetical protein
LLFVPIDNDNDMFLSASPGGSLQPENVDGPQNLRLDRPTP